MKCAVIKKHGKEIENLVIQEREDLVARGENIRVRVTATAINRADLLQRRGLYPAPPGAPQDVPGQRLAVPVPEGMSDNDAAAIPEAFISAHDALVSQGGMKAGDLVLIHAVAGGVGSAALQLAHRWGARAIGTAGSSEKLERIAELAPLTAINYKEENFQERIQELFGPNAVDLILDTVGADYWQKNLATLKTCGRLILFGLMSGFSAETSLTTLLTKRLRIIGTTLRSRPLEEKILATQAFAHQVLPLLAQGRLQPVIDSVVDFDKLHEATERMERNENTGKIVLTFT
jgi:NADPH2:quinone reductase